MLNISLTIIPERLVRYLKHFARNMVKKMDFTFLKEHPEYIRLGVETIK